MQMPLLLLTSFWIHFCLQQWWLGCLPKGDFLFLLFLIHSLTVIQQERTAPAPLCTYLFNYLSQTRLMINDLQSITDLTTGCSFKLVPESFRQAPSFLSTLLPQDIPGSDLCPRSAICPRSSDSFLWRIVFRNQDLGILCAYSYWGVTAFNIQLWYPCTPSWLPITQDTLKALSRAPTCLLQLTPLVYLTSWPKTTHPALLLWHHSGPCLFF